MPEEEKRAHFYFLSISRLLKRFENGEYHVAHKHWTGNAISDSILAEQHIIMYADEENGDVLDMSRIESGKVKIEEKRSIYQI